MLQIGTSIPIQIELSSGAVLVDKTASVPLILNSAYGFRNGWNSPPCKLSLPLLYHPLLKPPNSNISEPTSKIRIHNLALLLLLCLPISFFLIIPIGLFSTDRVKQFNMESDFGCGFLLFGSFGHLFKGLGLIVLFLLGLQFLRINCYFFGFINCFNDFKKKSPVLNGGFCSKSVLDAKSTPEAAPVMQNLLDDDKIGKAIEDDKLHESNNDSDFGGRELCDEDVEFDVLKLRKMIKIERGRAHKACLDLESERLAAATASEEAMSMILRLQTEKSLIELEAKQYRRLAEEKQSHNQEVIKSLQWLLLNHESDRGLFSNEFSSCRKKLMVSPTQCDEGDTLRM